jgi:hypothetical protein
MYQVLLSKLNTGVLRGIPLGGRGRGMIFLTPARVCTPPEVYSFPIVKVSPLFTTMLDEGSPNMHNSYKRPHQYSLLPEDEPLDCENVPVKKPKLLLTTVCCFRLSKCKN